MKVPAPPPFGGALAQIVQEDAGFFVKPSIGALFRLLLLCGSILRSSAFLRGSVLRSSALFGQNCRLLGSFAGPHCLQFLLSESDGIGLVAQRLRHRVGIAQILFLRLKALEEGAVKRCSA